MLAGTPMSTCSTAALTLGTTPPGTKLARVFYDVSVSWSTLNVTLCRSTGT